MQSEDVVRLERIPVEHGGDVLTGAKIVFRGAPGRTAESLQRLLDCQMARSLSGSEREPDPRVAMCPLAVRGVSTRVQPAPDGFAVEVTPRDAATSKRISHTLVHGLMAAELERFESTECRSIPPKERAACPLLGPVAALDELPAGVRVHFTASASAGTLIARMRCHYSFAQERGFSEEAAACPLYMRGLHIEKSPDGKAIDLTITPPGLVAELRSHVRDEAVFAPSAQRQK